MAKMMLNCPTCGERREMRSVRRATGTGGGCALILISLFLGAAGFAFFPVWLVALPLLLWGLYLGSKAETVWLCSTCRATIPKA